MKKSSRPDFRRETMEIISDNKLSVRQIVDYLGIHPNTAYRWIRGDTSPTQYQFERLKDLAVGQPEPSRPVTTAAPPDHPPDLIARFMGHIDQLTKQIAQLQGEVAILRNDYDRRMTEGEKKIRELESQVCHLESDLSSTIRTQAEHMASHLSRSKKAG